MSTDVEQVRRLRTRGPVAASRCLALTGLGFVEAFLALWLALVVLLCCLGIGILLLPGALSAVRGQARRQRRLAQRWSGVRVADPYASDPDAAEHGWRRAYRMLGDSATWRDLLWLVVNPFVAAIQFLPALAVVHGVFGLLFPFMWSSLTVSWDNTWYDFVPINGQTEADIAAVLGVVEIILGLWLLPRLVLVQGGWVRRMLGQPSRAVLTHRVDHLTRSRSDAMDFQAGELRRIERDLHDGAQVRLVALGLTLSAAQSMVRNDPDAVAALLAEAKDSSVKALNEIRDLVHGVHPPLLADRGLVDAVRTLGLELPLRVVVTGALPGRPPAPVESAAYFAVAELLSNAVKHGRATEVDVDIHHRDGVLTVVVSDNGAGGADASKGGGLRGVERRLGAFDGVLALDSPAGGPTTADFDLACDLDRNTSPDAAAS